MDDHKIIELFFERSEQAIIELSAKYGSLCNKIAMNILNNRLDAEECVNDSYLASWNTIPPQKPDPLRTYICRIVRNLSIKKYHSNTALKRNSFYDVALDELENCIPSNATLEEACDAKELARAINQFLSTLEPENRIMFVRRYWYSDSITEIAAKFQISNHNATVRLSRIRKRLEKFLLKEGIYV
ncbi:MAG: sigma-70 family RNA polymerase sigma factor [Tyzzerella sp.]|nr:sigma-70 family RNA polymerase sigma factor [Tyzzerella sp.]